jgi:hypothetical protein
VSAVVVKEIARTRSPRRELLEQVLRELRASLLDVSPEVEVLAGQYAVAGIVPARFQDDLLHVCASVHCYGLFNSQSSSQW